MKTVEDDKHLIILGIRGLPASHGGFETFAEYLSLYLVKKGWRVTVYCQEEIGLPGVSSERYESSWEGVELVHIPVKGSGAMSSVIFDYHASLHSLRYQGVFLTLGYNTAIFNILHRLRGKKNLINMDGIEWKRDKWSSVEKAWFWINERIASRFGNHLIADHPEIKVHLKRRATEGKITTIPYGAKEVLDADISYLDQYGLVDNQYAIVIARPEPENSILEIVKGFSSKIRGRKLVVLGNFKDDVKYHQEVKAAASSEVIFPGAIYDIAVVSALRYYATCYVHGHTVGGTNPSLVEALGCASPTLAHDNKFNRWVAGNSALYFKDVSDVSSKFDHFFSGDDTRAQLRRNARAIYNRDFTWDNVLGQYERLLSAWHP